MVLERHSGRIGSNIQTYWKNQYFRIGSPGWVSAAGARALGAPAAPAQASLRFQGEDTYDKGRVA